MNTWCLSHKTSNKNEQTCHDLNIRDSTRIQHSRLKTFSKRSQHSIFFPLFFSFFFFFFFASIRCCSGHPRTEIAQTVPAKKSITNRDGHTYTIRSVKDYGNMGHTGPHWCAMGTLATLTDCQCDVEPWRRLVPPTAWYRLVGKKMKHLNNE